MFYQHELIWVEWTSLYLPKKGRESNGYLSLKSEQKAISSHKVVQHNQTTNPKRFSKSMYNFLKIWHIKERKNFFFSSVYMKINWTFNYLKVMRRIQPIFSKKQRKRKQTNKKKQERKKTKIFFSIYLFIFLYIYIWKWTRRVGQSSDFILIMSNRLGKCVGDKTQLRKIATY